MSLPRDINILVSMLNMMLRDDDMSLETIIETKGESYEEILRILMDNGYEYQESINQIKVK
ncbi:MAG: DUF4250 domain-containing protein [Beduini sp.]|uniref:DUF4250 domain-containing protein n=1 Tax=Beduini sp. TaxID=1922300 RepID=UPI0011CB1329